MFTQRRIRYKYIALFLSLFLVTPVFAHGGVEKVTGNTLVVLNQEPLSPYVGEPVHFSFSLKDKDTLKSLSNLPVTISFIDTFMGDEAKDKTLTEQSVVTDANGSFDITYTFTKENYFDVELMLTDSTAKTQMTGFLVEARNHGSANKTKMVSFLILAFLFGGFSGILLGATKHSKS